jgi:hypothetical protein
MPATPFLVALALSTPHLHQEQDPQGKVFCPVCVANGYAASTTSTDRDWFLTGNSVGGALWYQGINRLQLGIGYHQSSQAVRGLFSYRLADFNDDLGLNIGYGFQSQETGSTGASATIEWNPKISHGTLNLYTGASYQTDERTRLVYGAKWSPDQLWFIGNQYDGRTHNPFIQRSFGNYSLGLIAINGKTLSISAGVSF